MSQLREYIEKHPSSAQRLVGLDYAQLMELIIQAEKQHNEKQVAGENQKTRLIKAVNSLGKDLRSIKSRKSIILLKPKRPTVKNQLIVMPSGQEIVDVVVGKPGATSDINIWRERRTQLSNTQKFQGDKAYVGVAAVQISIKSIQL